MKKHLALILAMILVFNMSSIARAQNAPLPYTREVTLRGSVHVKFNGDEVCLKDTNGNTVLPIFFDGSHYLPLRALSGLVGLGVAWDGATKTVSLTSGAAAAVTNGKVSSGDRTVTATIATNFTVTLDGAVKNFSDEAGNAVYPVLYNGTTYLPVRAVANLVGLTTDWDSASKSILLSSGKTDGILSADTSGAISPLGMVREFAEIKAVDGVEPFSEYWYSDSNAVSADFSDSPALAYSLTISDITEFSSLPKGYDPEALIEWGKDPGLNVDILHKYGFTGKGAVVAYVDQPIAPHEQYSDDNVHYTNNTTMTDSMHGPAVLSLLAGKEIGTAPEAEIFFYAHASWLADQSTHAECLYQIIEKNKTLPDSKKITMIGFSDNIDSSEKNGQMFRDAVAACEEAGIMVWFCGVYGALSFLPLSDKNNYRNTVVVNWGPNKPNLVYVPSSGRTTAATIDDSRYIYWSDGGLSWTMPYVLGLYAIAIEIDPTLTQDDLRELIVSTAYDNNGLKTVNPVGFIAQVLKNVGRSEEAQAMLAEVAARQKYLYAVMDTASMSDEDLTAVGEYLATVTDATVLVADAASFANAEKLYAVLKADAENRGGQVVGVQIFGNANMVPAFQVQYKVQMPDAVDEGGLFLTDLFYGNFNNNSATIANGYTVLDHFAESWGVDLVPEWPVARLPLSKGEFSAFFDKYTDFAEETGLERQEIVNFSNPIFKSTNHMDDMGAFLNRMNGEFDLLDVPYRLYGNLEGQYPVTTTVLGGFTAENLAAENDAGTLEFIINTHGQWNNIDKCYYVNGEEIRESLINMDTINSVLDGNAYYLDCWTCLNGYEMSNNLTTTALNGQCVGMFSATTVISNNGVNNKDSVSEMAKSNFYYFYYHYLKALNEGATRSTAFFTAQKEYAFALIADSANGIRNGEGNYQFNLYNLLAYHNFGVLEPNVAASLFDVSGYITQAGQSTPKETGRFKNTLTLTDGKPVGKSVKIKYNVTNMLKSGVLDVHSFTAQKLDNDYIRFTLECTAREGMPFSVFNPPNGDVFMLYGGTTTGEKQTIVYDIPADNVRSVDEITMRFNFVDDDRAFLHLRTNGIA